MINLNKPWKRDPKFPNSIRDKDGMLIFRVVFPDGGKTCEDQLRERHIVDQILDIRE